MTQQKTEPKAYSFEKLQEVLKKSVETDASSGQHTIKYEVYLYLTKRWMDWADPTLGEARVLQAKKGETETLIVTFSGGLLGGLEKIEFDPRMKFFLKR